MTAFPATAFAHWNFAVLLIEHYIFEPSIFKQPVLLFLLFSAIQKHSFIDTKALCWDGINRIHCLLYLLMEGVIFYFRGLLAFSLHINDALDHILASKLARLLLLSLRHPQAHVTIFVRLLLRLSVSFHCFK